MCISPFLFLIDDLNPRYSLAVSSFASELQRKAKLMMRRMGRRMRKAAGRNKGQAKARGREGEEVAKVGGGARGKRKRRMQPHQKDPSESRLQMNVLRMTQKPVMIASQHPRRKHVPKQAQKPKRKPKPPLAILQ